LLGVAVEKVVGGTLAVNVGLDMIADRVRTGGSSAFVGLGCTGPTVRPQPARTRKVRQYTRSKRTTCSTASLFNSDITSPAGA
jgi:hypothetical protein